MRTALIVLLGIIITGLALYYLSLNPVNPWIIIMLGLSITFLGCFWALDQDSVSKFLIITNTAQLGFVLVDGGISVLSGKAYLLGLLQLINYSLGVVLLMLCLKGFTDFSSVRTSKYSLVGLGIACLSLGGMPFFSVFVSEFMIYSFAAQISTALTGLCVIASLLLFLCYAHVLLAGINTNPVIRRSKSDLLILALSVFIIVLGVIPQIQFMMVSYL